MCRAGGARHTCYIRYTAVLHTLSERRRSRTPTRCAPETCSHASSHMAQTICVSTRQFHTALKVHMSRCVAPAMMLTAQLSAHELAHAIICARAARARSGQCSIAMRRPFSSSQVSWFSRSSPLGCWANDLPGARRGSVGLPLPAASQCPSPASHSASVAPPASGSGLGFAGASAYRKMDAIACERRRPYARGQQHAGCAPAVSDGRRGARRRSGVLVGRLPSRGPARMPRRGRWPSGCTRRPP
jgi:hypothetical protein